MQGVIAAAEVDPFNEPFYSPCLEELRGAVEQEGSFEILGLERHGILERGPSRSKAMARFTRVLDEWLARPALPGRGHRGRVRQGGGGAVHGSRRGGGHYGRRPRRLSQEEEKIAVARPSVPSQKIPFLSE